MGRDQAHSFSLAVTADLARAKPPRSSKGWLCRFLGLTGTLPLGVSRCC
jgi:hypothetical protein